MSAVAEYTYLRPSSLGPDSGLLLHTSGDAASGVGAHPRLFTGFMTTPEPQLDADVRGVNRLAELLLDEHIRRGLPVTDKSLRRWLDEFGHGSTRLARAARRLLQLA